MLKKKSSGDTNKKPTVRFGEQEKGGLPRIITVRYIYIFLKISEEKGRPHAA